MVAIHSWGLKRAKDIGKVILHPRGRLSLSMTQLKRSSVDKKLLPAIAYQQRMLLNIPVNKERYPPLSH